MYKRIAFLLCLVPWILIGCGESGSQLDGEGEAPDGQVPSSGPGSGDSQGIDWGPDVGMVVKQRISMNVMMVDEFAKAFSTADYPVLADAIRGVEVLRRDPSVANAIVVEDAINAFNDNILMVDEPKQEEIVAEVMGRMMQMAMMDYMVQTTRVMMDALVAAFPPTEYPQMQEFRRVAEDAIANPSMESGDTLNAAVDAFKASLSQADLARFDEIESSVEHTQAVVATEQGNEATVEMWLGDTEEQKNQVWSTPGPRISKVAYNEIEEGMSYEQVVAILEREGNSSGKTTSIFNGVRTVSEPFQWVWENVDGTRGKIEGYFLNNELRAKVYFNDLK